MTRDAATAHRAVAIAELDDALVAARSAFARAASATVGVEWVAAVAGEPVRFRFAGDALIDHLVPAIEHLEVSDRLPVLTVNVWDTASTGAPVPFLAGDEPAGVPARAVVGRSHAASFSWERGVFEGFDRDAGEAWFAVRSPDVLTHGERGAPFRLVFHWWSAPRRALAHAGAVGLDGAGLLLVGPGGAGKSSTALTCAEAGFEYAADDYCLVTADPVPIGFGLYGTGKVWPDDVGLYPTLRDTIGSLAHARDDKALFVVSRSRRSAVAAVLPLCAIVVPRLGSTRESRATRASGSRALQALAPSTVAQLAGGAASTVRVLAELSRALPCFELELGTDRSRVPDAVASVIAEANA